MWSVDSSASVACPCCFGFVDSVLRCALVLALSGLLLLWALVLALSVLLLLRLLIIVASASLRQLRDNFETVFAKEKVQKRASITVH